MLRLSLLRSPDFPDPHADEGHHAFTYSLYPHGGTWQQALTIRQGYELNYPLIAIAATNHAGSLPDARSFLDVREDNVIVSAVKKAEDGDALIVRFYEWAGREETVHLHLPIRTGSFDTTNLIEQNGQTTFMDTSSEQITVPVAPYEIKTVKVSLR